MPTRLTYVQDKILQSMGRSQDVMVTNDGATILKSLYVDNPAAKVLVGNQYMLSYEPSTASPLHNAGRLGLWLG